MFKKIKDYIIDFFISDDLWFMKGELVAKDCSLRLLQAALDNVREEHVKLILENIDAAPSVLTQKVRTKIIDLIGWIDELPFDTIRVDGKPRYFWNLLTPTKWLYLYQNDIIVPKKYIIWTKSAE